MIAIRSQSFSASRMMCVENTTHLPCSRSSATVFSSARATSTSSPEVASSKISTGGSWTRARAMETFCFMPVDILAPSRSRISSICSRWNSSSIRDRRDVFGQAVQPAEVFDHLPGGHPVVDGRVGGHEADLPPHLRRLRDHVRPVDGGRAAGGPQHGAEDPQGRRLAGAVGPQQAVDLSGISIEADPAQRHQFAASQIGVVLGEFVNVDHRTPSFACGERCGSDVEPSLRRRDALRAAPAATLPRKWPGSPLRRFAPCSLPHRQGHTST